MEQNIIALVVILLFVEVVLVKGAVVVPQRFEFVIERLGKYRTTLEAVFHIPIPFFDRVAYKRTLKKEPIDIAAQTCITADNVTLEVDGILYIQVVNSK
jgi:regulator of protease activity HflC (stomatin/prohibitin superfamily)